MNHTQVEVKEKLIDDIWAMVNEIERLTTLEQSKSTNIEAKTALNELVDISTTVMVSDFLLTYVAYDEEGMPTAYEAMLLVQWSLDTGNQPFIIEVRIVNPTSPEPVGIMVTKDNPATTILWEYALKQVSKLVDNLANTVTIMPCFSCN